MAFLADNGTNHYFFLDRFVGGNERLKIFVYYTPDALATVLAASYFTISWGQAINAGNLIQVYRVTDRNDPSTYIEDFTLMITDVTGGVLTVEALSGPPAATVATRTELAAATPALGTVYLSEAGREGDFAWQPTVPIVTHQTDTLQNGVYVAPSAGADGAWVRLNYDGVGYANWFGAVGDGVTDARAALVAANTFGRPIHLRNGAYLLSSAYDPTVPLFHDNATFAITGGAPFNPRFQRNIGLLYDWTRKFNASTTYTDTPAAYTYLTEYGLGHFNLVNAVGYQSSYSANNIGGNNTGRTLVPGFYIQASHSGYGDLVTYFASIAMSRHASFASVTKWTGNNSGTPFGAQLNASTDQVNLIGGEFHISDQAKIDVTGIGWVLDFTRTGTESATYSTPWIGIRAQVQSTSTLYSDAAFQATGKWRVGLDLASLTLDASAACLVLPTSGRIYMGGTAHAPASDQWSAGDGAASIGTTYLNYDGTYIESVVAGVSMIKVRTTYLEVGYGTNDAINLRVKGASATAFASLGQFNAISYFTAGTTGTEGTTLVLRTATTGGVETDRLSIDSAGVMDYKHGSTAASVAANFTADQYIQIKANGTTVYVPCRLATW